MPATIEFSYWKDRDDEGHLRVRYSSAPLSGEFDWFVGYLGTHHLEPFARQLASYPLDSANPPLLELYEGTTPGLRIEIVPSGPRGELTMTLRMNDEMIPENLLQIRTPITYAAVQRLADGLLDILRDGEGSFAIDLN